MTQDAGIAEPARLEAVRASGLLDSKPDPDFDRLAQIAAQLLHAPAAFVTILDDERQFFKSAAGDGEASNRMGTSIGLEQSLCKHAVAGNVPFVIADARSDPRTAHDGASHDTITAYAGVPLHAPDGSPIGAICVVDLRPREWTGEEIETLRALARSASALIAEQHPSHEHASRDGGSVAAGRMVQLAKAHLHAADAYEAMIAEASAPEPDREAMARAALIATGEHLARALEADGACAGKADAALVAAVRAFVVTDGERERLARAFGEGASDLAALEAAIALHMDAADILRVAVLDRGVEL